MEGNQILKYGIGIRIMHWVVGLMVICMLSAGLYMTSLPDSPEKFEIYKAHKAFGVITFTFVLIRLCVRAVSNIPRFPSEITRFETMLSKINIFALYGMMLAMPISGYVMSVASGRGVNVFGLMMPEVVPHNPFYAGIAYSIHTNLWYVFIGLITLHILGGFKHYIFEKINLFKRIM